MKAVLIIVAGLFAAGLAVAQTQKSELQSQGVIHNVGTVVIRGNATMTQDSIGGRVEYVRNNPLDSQRVAQLIYDRVHFEGRSVKRLLQPSTNLEARTLFSSLDSTTIFDLDATAIILAQGTVTHSGLINPGQVHGTVRLNGIASQDLSGSGFSPVLEIANPTVVSVSRGGGLRVGHRLDLQQGRLNSTVNDNLVLDDNAWIWRSDRGTIDVHPSTGPRMHMRYYGVARVAGGPELPVDALTLGKLSQDNVGGLVLPWDIVVNDSMRLVGHIYTEPSDVERYGVVYTPLADPAYVNDWPEVNGTLVRTGIVAGRPVRMNNVVTTFQFADQASMGDVRRIRLRSKPHTVPLPVDLGADKIRRFLQLSMRDSSDAAVPDGSWFATFGYSWRNDSVEAVGGEPQIETIPLLRPSVDTLRLLRYDGSDYVTDGVSVTPTRSTAPWRFSTASVISNSGDFAIGLSSSAPIYVLRARLFLEGAVRTLADKSSPMMATDLRDRSLVPSTPPREYPFTLDPTSASIVVPIVPDSVVDWMVVELRSQQSGEGTYYRTVMLTRGGYLIDPSTQLMVTITDVQPGSYYLVFRHRNHLAVMTDTPQPIERTNRSWVDLTTGSGVFGGASAQKVVGVGADGRRVFGLIAGDVDHDHDILRVDQALVWTERDFEGYSRFDTDMDGIISTRDWNISWNNRGSSSVVPR